MRHLCIHPVCTVLILRSLNYSETGTTIEIRSSCIKKTYAGTGRKARISHLRTVYQLLRQKNVPHVDSVLNIFDDKSHGAVAYLQPKGVNRRPTLAQEVLEAMLCLLEALTVCLCTRG